MLKRLHGLGCGYSEATRDDGIRYLQKRQLKSRHNGAATRYDAKIDPLQRYGHAFRESVTYRHMMGVPGAGRAA